MREATISILIISLGVLLAVFPRAVAREGIRQNNKFFRLGSIRLNFGEREEKVSAWG